MFPKDSLIPCIYKDDFTDNYTGNILVWVAELQHKLYSQIC